VVTQIVCVAWALGRGSDTVSGEIGRGTMDLIASLPVHRGTMLFPPAVMATFGAAVLCGSVMLGTAVGLQFVSFPQPVAMMAFLPGALNLFSLVFFLTGLTAMISSCSRDRWRTMAIAGGAFVLAVIVELVRRVWHAGDWLKYTTFMSAFQPQELILMAESRGAMIWVYNGTLLGLGLACYGVAALAFTYRDIPGPR
jgi:ABC-2 type transport system permease protein